MDIEEDILLIHQLVDFSEMVLPFEARNRYEIRNKDGDHLYFAFELGGTRWFSWILRSLLVNLRPFSIRVTDSNQKDLLSLKKPFRFYFHRADVYEQGIWVGAIQRRFSLINELFNVIDSEGNELCEIKGPIWKPWTFNVIQNKKIYGSIRKSWRGWAGEVLTDSDTFGIQFPDGATTEEKKVLLAAVFLIDFIYFEGNAGMNYAPDIGI
jgi:uncharacterized protein YxjI